MSEKIVPIERLASTVMEGLKEYSRLCADEVKKSVKKASTTVRKEISENAPKRTGRYAKSWQTKTTKEDSTGMIVTVYSPSRYMLAHLLEFGHAKRKGGRVRAIPHIEPAEQHGNEQLEKDIRHRLEAL